MGITVVSYVLVGCDVTGKLYRDIKKPGCDHAPDRSLPFCPHCGKPSEVTSQYPIPGYDEGNTISLRRYRNLDVVKLRHPDSRHFAGRIISRIEGWIDIRHSQIEVPPFGSDVATADALKSIELWDATWGTYHLLYVNG